MQSKDTTKIFQLIKGAVIGTMFSVFSVLMFAFIVYKGFLSDEFYIPLLLVSTLLCGLITGYSAVRKLRKNGLPNGVLSAIVPSVFLLISMIIANGGFNKFLMIPIAVILLSGAAGGILAVNIKFKHKRK